MPDYIYLLENRLSADQQAALRILREAAREAGTILFLTGDAVRDLTSGHAVRDLEVAVHGNALKLKKTIEKSGGNIWGEDETLRALYLCFPGTVRVDLVSCHRTEYPKPGKPVYHPASIQEDLRRRDFTVNAMAISLNEGSFGLLMDPMNGAADIESRTLRLVSNYGFYDEPSMMIRATRYAARLGWELDPKTRTRYQNARDEGLIEHLSPLARSRELEQIGHEEDGLKILQAFETEGWMSVLFPAWTAAKADVERLSALHELAVELLLQGVHADMSAAQMRLLTARLAPKDLSALKKAMLRPGFVEEWNSLDSLAAGFSKALLAKENQTPSASFKLFRSYDPEAVLWLGFTSEDPAVKERYNLFLKTWPELRQSIPYALMLEMRITPELPNYTEIVQSLFLELIDGKLTTTEEARAFLEPHSPPAPPPQVTIKRTRAKRGSEAKLKEPTFEDDEEAEDALEDEDDLDDIGGEDDLDLGLALPKLDLGVDLSDEGDDEVEDEEEPQAPSPPPAKPTPAKHGPKAPVKPVAPVPTQALKEAPLKPESIGSAPSPSSASSETQVETEAPAKAKSAVKAKGKPELAPAPPKVKDKSSEAPVAVKSAATGKKPTQGPVRQSAPAKAKPHKPAPTAPVKAPSKPAAKPSGKAVEKALARKHSAKVPAKTPAHSVSAAKSKPAPVKKPISFKAAKAAPKKAAPKAPKKRK